MKDPIILKFECNACGKVCNRDSHLDTCPRCGSHDIHPVSDQPVEFKRGNLAHNVTLEVHSAKHGQKSSHKKE